MDINGLKTGTVLKGKSHNYRIKKILGSGSFGITYLADVIFDESSSASTSLKVTIKEFFMKDFNGREGSSVTSGSKDGYFGKYLSKFNQEAQKLSTVRSEGVVKVLELFQSNNTSYYVMQYLSGGSLNDLIYDRGVIPERYALQFGLQIASALKDIHEKKMLHLDLKPSNIMLSGTGQPVLIDFGLSKQYTENGEPESSTTIGGGTRGYAPIEQAQYHDGNDFPVTMDVYAFGGTLFKMLTGTVPPDASSILNDGFPKEVLIRSGVSPTVASYIEKLMSPMKKGRPQSMEAVISDIISIGSRTNIADKSELSSWINGPSFSQSFNNYDKTEDKADDKTDYKTEDETEVEIISVVKGGVETQKEAVIDSSIDKLEIKVILDPNKTGAYNWFSITASSKQLIVIKSKKGEITPVKKTFFFSEEKFSNLKSRVQHLNLRCEKKSGEGTGPLYGVCLKTYKGNHLDFSAATYEDDMAWGTLTGNVDSLVNIAWKESGLVSLDSVSSKNSKLGKVVSFVRTPRKWIGYFAIVLAVFLYFVSYEPFNKYIDNNFKNKIIKSWETRATSNYELAVNYEGLGGVLYAPTHEWIIPPQYNPGDNIIHDNVYLPKDAFRQSGLELLAQQDGYALINVNHAVSLFYNGKVVSKLSTGDYGEISKVQKGLYEITYHDNEKQDFINSLYDAKGNAIIPFTDKVVNVISDDVIKVARFKDQSYYDITGKPINSFNFVVFYDQNEFMVNFIAIVVISLLLSLIANLVYRKVKKKRGK